MESRQEFRLKLLPSMDWAAEAACRYTLEPELWFPLPNDGKQKVRAGQYTEAKKVCSECPVRQECLDYAVDNHEKWGMWGGKTPKQRYEYARERKAKSLAL